MRKVVVVVVGTMAAWAGVATPAYALPALQVYIDGAAAGDWSDPTETDTWRTTVGSSDPVNLFVVASYGPKTTNFTDLTLRIGVPEGETGTVSFTNIGDGTPALLRIIGVAADGSANAFGDANLDLLTDVAGLDGYAAKEDFSPVGLALDSSDPTKNADANFILFSLGAFSDDESPLNNYNAEDGTITSAGGSKGEEKHYRLSATGFSWLHFDVYGLDEEVKTTGRGTTTTWTWGDNPGSHDGTAIIEEVRPPPPVIPEPSSMLLMGSGLLGALGFNRSRRTRA